MDVAKRRMEEIKKFPPIEVDLGTVSKLTDRAVSCVLLQNPWKLDEIRLFPSFSSFLSPKLYFKWQKVCLRLAGIVSSKILSS